MFIWVCHTYVCTVIICVVIPLSPVLQFSVSLLCVECPWLCHTSTEVTLRQCYSCSPWPTVDPVLCQLMTHWDSCYWGTHTLLPMTVRSMDNPANVFPEMSSNEPMSLISLLSQEWHLGGDVVHSCHEAGLEPRTNKFEDSSLLSLRVLDILLWTVARNWITWLPWLQMIPLLLFLRMASLPSWVCFLM